MFFKKTFYQSKELNKSKYTAAFAPIGAIFFSSKPTKDNSGKRDSSKDCERSFKVLYNIRTNNFVKKHKTSC